MWVHLKYGMSQIVLKLYSVKTNNCSYPDVPDDGWLNQWNNETYDLQWKNSKIMMTKTIIINCIAMYCSIII